MKIDINRRLFFSNFQTVASVSPARTPREILKNVKLVTGPDGVMMYGTDSEISVSITINEGVVVHSPGSVLLPVGRFGSILRESTDEELTLILANNQLNVRGARSQFRIPTTSPDEFPSLSQERIDGEFKIPGKEFESSIKRTAFATDMDSTRYALSGIKIEVVGNTIYFVACNGRSLSYRSCEVESLTTEHAEAVIPLKSCLLAAKLFGDSESVAILFKTNEVWFISDKARMSARLLEGRFPRWRDVLPDVESRHAYTLNSDDLLSSVRQASIVLTETSVAIDMKFDRDGIRITSQSAEYGDANSMIPFSDHKASTSKIEKVAINAHYLSDYLKTLGSEAAISLFPGEAGQPIAFRTDENNMFIIMPMTKE